MAKSTKAKKTTKKKANNADPLRKKLVEQIAPRNLSLYERVAKRFGRAVVPVQSGTCLGCFMSLPTQHIGVEETDNRVENCENCGRILYWL